METFIVRQPIFDSRKRVFGYELLFRSNQENVFRHPDPDQATSIIDAFFLFNISTLAGGKRAFINFTRETLLKEYAVSIPKESIVVEILKTIDPDSEVIKACRKLKQAGYLLAMGDFAYEERYAPLMDVADFVRIDFLSTGEREKRSLFQAFAPLGIRLLAEKVETSESFSDALEIGYPYFQGNFFCKPSIIRGKDIPGFKLHYLQILRAIHHPEMDFSRLEETIKKEVSLSYRLLRYINSASFGLTNKINSIKHALALLGEKEIKKWVSLVVLAIIGQDKPEELALRAITRAKFCESLAPYVDLKNRAEDLFLVGMFSLIDAFLDRAISEILNEIPIGDEIKGAILGEENSLGEVYKYVLSYEKGDWIRLTEQQIKLRIDETPPPQLYLKALKWGQEAFQQL